ncbi:MAG: sugar transferase, partial [Candidatus Falkowbacteria bacterium]|nr:sugar transferase [Candidatus Falkowbacteria bacterium]
PSYEDTMKKLQYDLFYIKNRSLYLDLSIILKTIATVLSKSGV